MLVEMLRRRINDDAFGWNGLMGNLDKVVRAEGNVVSSYSNGFGRCEARESSLIGPFGHTVMIRSSF
ncbi:hypothetical protein D3C81_1415980 [compost metagenome]